MPGKVASGGGWLPWAGHHIVPVLFVGASIALAAGSGPFADKQGFGMLREHFGEEATQAKGLHSLWYDVGQEFVPALDVPVWLSDSCVWAMLTLWGLSSIADMPRFGTLYRRWMPFCWVLGIVMLLRSASIYSTVHAVSPVIAKRIQAGELLSDIETTIGYMGNTSAFDMMFSGHTSICIICMLFCLTSSAPVVLKLLALLGGSGGAAVQVLVGDHYTADVLVGFYTSLLVFLLVTGWHKDGKQGTKLKSP